MEGVCLISCGGGVFIVLEMLWVKGGEGYFGIFFIWSKKGLGL